MSLIDLPIALCRMLVPGQTTFDLSGKVALVTGGGDGIGRQTVTQLADKGASVVVVDRDETAAKDVVATLGEHRALAIGADVTDRTAMRMAVEQAVGRFGRLDLVVANAGITPPAGTLRGADPQHFDAVLNVNVTGVLNTVLPAVDHLISSRGHIVVVASCAAFCPPVGGAAYMISKAATEQLSRAFRLELAPHGVSVTTCYYGIVETELTRNALDSDELGAQLNSMLPGPLRRRITATEAASALVSGVEHRSSSVMSPGAWWPVSALRGILTPLMDLYLVDDRRVHELLRKLETTCLPSAPEDAS
ncbi:short-chain dehydrogenase/reductase [Speluncibacter jeojiensis]|uniref:short-chain dehydrogenase/reductase n=1 Tax=Speluncibacter jeojiensis TaxID=2710754 RepID=UPI00241043BC|nr:short-chain dehydrogenase/reductase [Rhodococcus sp. D2-41]